ncbi:type II toxin-antitoxin system RelE/ParE family toxin [Candidatus Dojkabacteria bacterium]|nr:type II toxin-antitoxin system RelE/ParE family toxin [Candidatus Dojkabacteria bacterium]
MKYPIKFTRSAIKEAKKLPISIWKRIKLEIYELSDSPIPSSSKRLNGYKNVYRIRIGSYRVIYELKHEIKIVLIVKIGHRRDIYRNL